MIKNVQISTKAEKPASSEPAKTAPRVIRSIGPKNPSDKVGNAAFKTAVIIKKAGSTVGTRPTSDLDQKSNKGGSAQTNAVPASPTGSRSGKVGSAPAKKNGVGVSTLPNAAAGDLRSVIAVNNSQRGLISAQNLPFLRRFVTEQGKILSRRLTRVTARQQREITKAIKQARILGYLQFVNTK